MKYFYDMAERISPFARVVNLTRRVNEIRHRLKEEEQPLSWMAPEIQEPETQDPEAMRSLLFEQLDAIQIEDLSTAEDFSSNFSPVIRALATYIENTGNKEAEGVYEAVTIISGQDSQFEVSTATVTTSFIKLRRSQYPANGREDKLVKVSLPSETSFFTGYFGTNGQKTYFDQDSEPVEIQNYAYNLIDGINDLLGRSATSRSPSSPIS